MCHARTGIPALKITKSDVVTWTNSYIEALVAFENRPDHPLAALMETHGGSGGGVSSSKPPINDAMTARDRRVHRCLGVIKECSSDWYNALVYYSATGSLEAVQKEMKWTPKYTLKCFDMGYACFRGVWAMN